MSILSLYNQLRLTDKKQLARWKKRYTRHQLSAEEKKIFEQKVTTLARRSLVPFCEKLKISYPEDLPVSKRKDELVEAIKNHSCVIVCGSTGSGKSTQLPKIAIEAGLGRTGRIGCTQPRRIAARSLAERVAAEMETDFGEGVGSKVRFEEKCTDNTIVKFMTDGTLLAESKSDKLLLEYDCIIVDEVHERSLNIDFLLGYLKNLLLSRRNLKLILSSATLEAEKLADFFPDSKIVEIEGRLYPVEDYFLPPEEDADLAASVEMALDEIAKLENSGDVLVFLPGEREIREIADSLGERKNWEILPLFGRLSSQEQQKVFRRGSKRRVILATNVAETSLTLPNIRYVVDSGLVRRSSYNSSTGIQELSTVFVSKSAIMQRRGRCGRLSNGVCFHLYTEEEWESAAEFTTPEILRSSLSGVILQMAYLNLPPLSEFPMLDKPNIGAIRSGERMLKEIGALSVDGKLTNIGIELAQIPLDPHLGRILIEGERRKVLDETIVCGAFLSIVDPRERPLDKQTQADTAHKKFKDETSDFNTIINLWCETEKNAASNGALRRFCKDNFLNYRRMRDWRNLVEELTLDAIGKDKTLRGEVDFEKFDRENFHIAILAGLPRNLGHWNAEKREYEDMQGRKFQCFPSSALAKQKQKAEWILFFHLLETKNLYSLFNAEINPEYLLLTSPQLLKKSYSAINFNPDKGFVYALEKQTFGKHVIQSGKRVHYGNINPVESRKIFIEEALARGNINANGSWTDKYMQKYRELRRLEKCLRREDLLVDEETLCEYFDGVLPQNCFSVKNLLYNFERDKKDYTPLKHSEFGVHAPAVPQGDFPAYWHLGNYRWRLIYKFEPGEEDDGVTALVPEKELNEIPAVWLEHLVPGYVMEKTERFWRAMPKEMRKALQPFNESLELFMAYYREHPHLKDVAFAEVLRDYLHEIHELDVDTDIWENVQLPEFLNMKIAVLDERGRVRRVVRELAENRIRRIGQLTGNNRRQEKYTVFPLQQVPEHISVGPDHKGYGALTDENDGVAIRYFVKENEAANQHLQGLVRLFILEENGLVRNLLRSVKFEKNVLLGMFIDYGDYKEHVLENAVAATLQDDFLSIRNSAQWENFKPYIRENVYQSLLDEMSQIEQCAELIDEINHFCRRTRNGDASKEEIQNQLDFYFADGFLRRRALWAEIPRYLKALKIRADKMAGNIGKDREKSAEIIDEIAPFYEKGASGVCADETLFNKYLIAEEKQIRLFAPTLARKR
ncbi:MAG: ATP-dependent RNA helicase HrpA [Lentisphaeria bacterium]|nr:ATP-dependent RNA helicase HrpA [Lentisphaeria bacterium]